MDVVLSTALSTSSRASAAAAYSFVTSASMVFRVLPCGRCVTGADQTSPMREPDTRDNRGLIEHHDAAPRGQRLMPAPVPARCTARSYGGDVVTVEGVVTHRAPGLLAFTA